MTHSIRVLTAFLLLGSAAPIQAGEWTTGNVTVKNVIWIPSIKGFYAPPEILNDPSVPNLNNPGNCSAKGLYQIAPTVTDLEATRMLAMLLTAKSTGNTVNVYVDGCGSQGPYFTGLQVNP